MKPSSATSLSLKPCPFCGETPDVNDERTFQDSQGAKWGSVVCCCTGPEVRTWYGPVAEWKDAAIAEWNKRAETSRSEIGGREAAYKEALRHILWIKDCGIDGKGEDGNLVNFPDAERDAMYLIAQEALVTQTPRSARGENDPVKALAAKLNEVEAARWRFIQRMWPIDLLMLLNSHMDGLDDMLVGEAVDKAIAADIQRHK